MPRTTGLTIRSITSFSSSLLSLGAGEIAPIPPVGTASDANGQLTAVGGRVLAVTGLGDSQDAARAAAYEAVAKIDWPEGFYRRDIASN